MLTGRNFKILQVLALAPLVLFAAFWIFLRVGGGEKLANQAASAILKRPLELQNSIENLQAHSSSGLKVMLPYTGTFTLEVTVLKGNNIDIFLANPEEYEKFKNDEGFDHLVKFAVKDTKNYKRDGRISAGVYYIILRDRTLGILSENSSDIKVMATLSP